MATMTAPSIHDVKDMGPVDLDTPVPETPARELTLPDPDTPVTEHFDTDRVYVDTTPAPEGVRYTHLDPGCPDAHEPNAVRTMGGIGQLTCWSCVPAEIVPTPRVASLRDLRQVSNRDDREQAAKIRRARSQAAEAEAFVDAMTPEAVEAWLDQLGRKVEMGEVTPQLQAAATLWAQDYDGDFSFMLDMRADAAKGMLSQGKAKGVLNCWRAALYRAKKQQKGTTTNSEGTQDATPSAGGLDLSPIPTGTYMVDGVTIKVGRPGTRSRWHGWTFVDDGGPWGNQVKYGRQGKDHWARYQGTHEDLLEKILADPLAAAVAYGKATGRCCVCSTELTNPESVDAGIGPICASKF